LPFALMAGDEPMSRSAHWPSLNAALGATGALLAVIVGAFGVMRWRLTGEAAALRIGVAVLFIGVATLAPVVGLIRPDLDPTSFPLVLGPAAALVGAIGFSVALVAPDVQSKVSARRLAVRSLLLLGVATLFVLAVPGLAESRGGVLSSAVGQPTPLRTITMVVVAALAVFYTYRGLQEARWLHTWIGLMLFAITLSLGFQMAATTRGDSRLTGSALLAVVGLAFALNGSARELAAAYTDQRAQLLDTTIHASTIERSQRAERAAREEQTHNATSALLAIQGAIRVLERESLALDPGPRSRLVASLDTELNRLRHLLSTDTSQLGPQSFRIAEVLEPVAICRGAAGARIYELATSEAVAFGRSSVVAEIVDNLVANAERHAPDSPIFLRTMTREDRVQIRVEDSGPGVPAGERERIFSRGESGHAEGSGLGLFVARRLAHQEGGELWVEDSEQGGAAFVLELPARQPVPPETSASLDRGASIDRPNARRRGAGKRA
jgi:signal transduction histidine kinase